MKNKTPIVLLIAVFAMLFMWQAIDRQWNKRWANPANSKIVTKDGTRFAVMCNLGLDLKQTYGDFANPLLALEARQKQIDESRRALLPWRDVELETNVVSITTYSTNFVTNIWEVGSSTTSVQTVEFSVADDSTNNSPAEAVAKAATN